MKTSLVTVGLPTFNRAELLPQAIACVLNQTFPNFELLIANDGSTDETEKVVRSFEDKRIRYFKNPKNLGLSKTIQRLALEAKGKYVLFFHDDDIAYPTLLEKEVKLFEKYPHLGYVWPQCQMVDKDRKVLIPAPEYEEADIIVPKGEMTPHFTYYPRKILGKYKFHLTFPSALFNKKTLLATESFDFGVDVAHDVFIQFKISLLSDVGVITEPLFEHVYHQQNLGSSLYRQGRFLDQHRQLIKAIEVFVKDRKLDSDQTFVKSVKKDTASFIMRPDGAMLRAATAVEGSYFRKVGLIWELFRWCGKENPAVLFSLKTWLTLVVSLIIPRVFLRKVVRLRWLFGGLLR